MKRPTEILNNLTTQHASSVDSSCISHADSKYLIDYIEELECKLRYIGEGLSHIREKALDLKSIA